MDLLDKAVTQKLLEFENEQEPALLQEALKMIEQAEHREVAHKGGLVRWLLFFTTLDRNSEPHWDPGTIPVTGEIPPPTYDIAYPSGVDPSVIAEPAIRTEYEQALKAGKEYAESYRVQLLLRSIDARATAFFRQWLKEAYAASPADWHKFESLIAASPINELRKEHLRDWCTLMKS